MANYMSHVSQGRRWISPIGPAPDGWLERNLCSRTIPHTEGDEWENAEMNAEHYTDPWVIYVQDTRDPIEVMEHEDAFHAAYQYNINREWFEPKRVIVSASDFFEWEGAIL